MAARDPAERLTAQIDRLARRMAEPGRFSAAELEAMQARHDDLVAQRARLSATAAQE